MRDEASILEAAVEYQRGGFSLRAEFVLRSAWTVLFGASGAGKTTLLRILAGLIHPSRGSIRLRGNPLVDTAGNLIVAPGQRKIGFVMQQASLFPHLTAKENIAFGLYSWARSVRDARTEEMLDIFEITQMADREPNQLSGGERQRVALAQALAPGPELLLLDEPFNALDAASRAEIIEELHRAGVPVLYVSHDLADAWQVSSDAIVLEAGRIAAHGETRKVLAAQREQILAQLEANVGKNQQSYVR